jgi:hypothetical protein
MRTQPKVTVTIEGWRFERVSSEYVDVTPPGQTSAVDCINVFDYERGTSDVPWTVAATRAAGRDWLADNAVNLADYVAMGRY